MAISLGYTVDVPLHVVYSQDEENNYIIITVYKASLEKWEDDFKTRRSKK